MRAADFDSVAEAGVVRRWIDLSLWRLETSGLLIGYARVSTEEQDLTAQRDGLAALGVEVERIYVDHGVTGSNRERPGFGRRWPPVAPATLWW